MAISWALACPRSNWADPLRFWGDLLAAQGKREEALVKYDAALKLAPKWQELKAARAYCRLDLRNNTDSKFGLFRKEGGMRVCPIFALAVIVAATPLAAQPRGLRYYDDLAETKVWDNLQEDVLPLQTGDRYSQVRICAFRKHVRLFGGSLRFADGSEQALPKDVLIPASGCLRKMMLAGGQRPIESVRLLYWAEIFGPMKADVKVYAR